MTLDATLRIILLVHFLQTSQQETCRPGPTIREAAPSTALLLIALPPESGTISADLTAATLMSPCLTLTVTVPPFLPKTSKTQPCLLLVVDGPARPTMDADFSTSLCLRRQFVLRILFPLIIRTALVSSRPFLTQVLAHPSERVPPIDRGTSRTSFQLSENDLPPEEARFIDKLNNLISLLINNIPSSLKNSPLGDGLRQLTLTLHNFSTLY